MSGEIVMPRLSDTMEEGVIARWLVASGEPVARGQALAEIETDKATLEIESEHEGSLQVVAPEGAAVAVGAVIARVHDGEVADLPLPAEPAGAADGGPAAPPEAGPQDPPAASVPAPTAPAPASGRADRVRATPVARRLARAAGVELAALSPGSGPHGRIQKHDVERHLAGAAARRAAPAAVARADDEVVRLTRVQALVAERMSAAKRDVPHYYLTARVEVGEAIELQRTMRELESAPITLTDVLVVACARALRRVPRVNASWVDGTIVRRGGVHVGVAVALEDDGLVVPVLRDADRLPLAEVALARADLVERARAGRLRPDELEQATFTISNLGGFGVDEFHAIVNPPQSGILAVGQIERHLVLVDGAPVERPRLQLSLSADHRVYSGATAAAFLAELREGLARPLNLLAHGWRAEASA